jgi:hypothetical protein
MASDTYLAQNKPNYALSEIKTPAPACFGNLAEKKRHLQHLSGIAFSTAQSYRASAAQRLVY